MQKVTVGIIGLGLMGGSIGLAIKSLNKNYHLIGLDHNKNHCSEALKLKLVDEISQTMDNIENCDIIFLSIPVDGIIKVIQNLKNLKKNCTVIDLGSTKYKITKSVPKNIRANFVAAHPMTGTENFGPSAAFCKLYQNKVVVLCDLEDSGEHQQDTAKNLFNDIGMNIVYMNSKDHDKHAAFISHMPHAMSYALANSVLNQEDPKSILAMASGGFESMSRIAKSSSNMWEDIFRQNRDNTIDAIKCFSKELDYCQRLLENEQYEELNHWMKQANILHKIFK
jgi:prephenate dehydrogenase